MSKIVPTSPSDDKSKEIARQITDQYHKAVGGMVDFIALGALGLQLQEMTGGVSACGHSSTTKGTGIKGWLAEHAPEVSRQTLYRSMEATENIKAEFKIGPRTDLYEALKGSKPGPKLLALREKITAFVEGKSQRQLLIGIGKPNAQIGGKRDAKVTPPTEEERRAAWLDDARQRSVATFSGLHELQERWKTLDDAQLKVAIDDAKAFAREAEAWLKTPPPSRAQLAVDELMKAADAADKGEQTT